MTENEIRKYIEELREKARLFSKSGYATAGMEKAFNKSADTIENLLNELEAYRAIGTVEEIQKKMEELERWHTDRINENIKNPFAYTSTSICHNCDHKDEYIEELESEVSEYKAIGTIEEFKALKEKNTPKKVAYQGEHEKCPNCGSFHVFGKHCTECGQAVDYD